VIDTLDAATGTPSTGNPSPPAWRLALLGRDTLRQSLIELGVPVVAWRGARSLDEVLLGLSRATSTSRRAR
jgi:hypothetical protein